MIHRDFCNPKYTKEYSSLRMQFHFLLSRHVCWDGLVSLSLKEMADRLSCSLQSIYKFIRKGIRDGILEQCGDRLYLLKRVGDYTQGYIKHYPFLESTEFQAMSLHAQRFVLYCLWSGVHTGRPLKRSLSALYHSSPERQGVLNLYTKKELYPVLEECKAFLKLEIETTRGQEKVLVRGLREEYALQGALENQGEKLWLEEQLWKEDCEHLVSSEAKENLLRMKKEYVNKFQEVGLELFCHALKKLMFSHKLFELNQAGEIGQYFRAILDELEEKMLPVLEKYMQSLENAYTATQHILVREADKLLTHFKEKWDKIRKAVYAIKNKVDPPEPKPVLQVDFKPYNWLEE
ncbi:hypothetical protein ACKE5C_18975 (plasmid) [Aneurinibacillus thermoaerophilus]|uniref:Helix-turn-helix domain-containing protein n=1 Tax=Aneurinibacillus thermoaerophilus TaxID=143495 RepID=A0ABX8YHC4_ANETH|nr:hypothetical protein [Aneurinibacillus thermoaerophilus]QYY44719.1 hypothetical protein K3F53_18925 [Aneurinibacillus thermoaerophilus]